MPLRFVAPNHPTPPQAANIIHEYDFRDTATMWEDTGGTMAITEGGDIARIDDKGSRGDNLTQGTASKRPIYEAAHFGARGGASYIRANIETLLGADSVGASAGGWTAAVIISPDSDGGGSESRIPWAWDSDNTITSQNDNLTAGISGGGLPSGGADIVEGSIYAVILNNDGATNFEARYSHVAAPITNSNGLPGPTPGTNVAAGQDHVALAFDGELGHIIIWVAPLTSGERDDLEVYLTEIWGITWA